MPLLHRGNRDIREIIHIVEHTKGMETAFRLQFHAHLQKLALGRATVFQLIRLDLYIVLFQTLDELLHTIYRGSRKGQLDRGGAQLWYQIVEHLKSQEHHRGRDDGGDKHARSASQTDGCCHP